MTPGGIRTRDLSIISRSNSDLHHGSWRGLAGNGRYCCCPCGHGLGRHEVTDIFTTALPTLVHRQLKGTLGNRRYRCLSDNNTASPLAETKLRRAACKPSRGRIPVRVSKAGVEPAFPMGAKYPKSSPPASVQPHEAANRITNKFFRGALKAPLPRTPQGSLCHRYPACASFPPAGPALSGTRLPARAPGSGSPVPACAGMFRMSLLRTTKNPPEPLAREGPYGADCRSRFTRDRSHEPGVRHRLTSGHSIL
jgi:hypothetical protein